MLNIPRPEYPRPQMQRDCWQNLNGRWEFEIDNSFSGKERGLPNAASLKDRITVPFCPESELSGVGFRDFMGCVWYRREVKLSPQWQVAIAAGERVILHFGAVDYQATVYVGGKEVCVHKGGYSGFSVDITEYIEGETVVITLCAEDDLRSHKQPAGKQSDKLHSYGCYYTRTTGIWQTVWMERVPQSYITGYRVYPDPENSAVRISVRTSGDGPLTVKAFYEGRLMAQKTVAAFHDQTDIYLELAEKHLWELGAGRLYDLEFSFGQDRVTGYFGLRSVRMEGLKFLLNGKSVFQRLVLDQGFYPDGIYTAPDEEALIHDIELSLAAGFNGARLHEKAFEPRFLYHCDRMGYMVWGEHANWNLDVTHYEALDCFLPEWMELVERDFNHPSVVGWCPLNETWDFEGRQQCNKVHAMIYRVTKAMDPTRPCIDTSGNYHVITDIFDVHDYDQNPETFKARYDELKETGAFDVSFNCGKGPGDTLRHTYKGEPVFISEYGGIKWDMSNRKENWGYGTGPQTKEEFISRYEGLTKALLDNDKICGFCYTQLYDVEQETNGLYTYHRVPKFDMEIFRKINTAKAAIEDEGGCV
ncbi:MAG: beta-galactosidase [Ruminococcaceae bacterium]|nr:beta-galactosidase [Oscillospiraceae bacterium]